MKTNKPKKGLPKLVTLDESEVVEACCKYLESKGFKLKGRSYLAMPSVPTRGEAGKMSFTAEVENIRLRNHP